MSTEAKKTVISFTILDDLNNFSDKLDLVNDSDKFPLTKETNGTIDEYIEFMKMIKNKFHKNDDYYDPTGLIDNWDDDFIVNMANRLQNNRYIVSNRVEKYYVMAFALDYTRFEVFSKDCDKQLIKWRDDDNDDKIVGFITDDEYNENPVIKLMKQLNHE